MKTRSNAKRATGKGTGRAPKWCDDPKSDKWREDCPSKYEMALYYLCDEMGVAFWEGRYGELLRNAAIIEALEIVANPQSAGMDAAAVAEMSEDVERETAEYRAEDDRILRNLGTGELFRALFSCGRCFVNEDTARDRRYFLRSPHTAYILKRMLKSEKMDAATVAAFLKTQTLDDDELKDPVAIRVNWLNSKFAFFADCYLSQWLDYVELPQTFAAEKLRAEIEENLGLFPLPFEYGADNDGQGIVKVSDSLLSLVRLLKITAARQGATAGGMKQAKFSELCGVSSRTVQNWDSGKTSPNGIKYVPRFYERDAISALTFAGMFRRMTGQDVKIIHDYKRAHGEISQRFIRDEAADLRRID